MKTLYRVYFLLQGYNEAKIAWRLKRYDFDKLTKQRGY